MAVTFLALLAGAAMRLPWVSALCVLLSIVQGLVLGVLRVGRGQGAAAGSWFTAHGGGGDQVSCGSCASFHSVMVARPAVLGW